jgi:hypothetical protein
MEAWLLERNIPFCDSMLRAQLYDLIKLNKPTHTCYVIDQILADKGHTVLRLPPYHPDLNPTELIWANVKLWVASKSTTFKIKDVEQLCRQRFEEIWHEEWENVCPHVEKVEQLYYAQEGIIEDAIERNKMKIMEWTAVINQVTSESEGLSGEEELEED